MASKQLETAQEEPVSDDLMNKLNSFEVNLY